jgi:hypothetical protein
MSLHFWPDWRAFSRISRIRDLTSAIWFRRVGSGQHCISPAGEKQWPCRDRHQAFDARSRLGKLADVSPDKLKTAAKTLREAGEFYLCHFGASLWLRPCIGGPVRRPRTRKDLPDIHARVLITRNLAATNNKCLAACCPAGLRRQASPSQPAKMSYLKSARRPKGDNPHPPAQEPRPA